MIGAGPPAPHHRPRAAPNLTPGSTPQHQTLSLTSYHILPGDIPQGGPARPGGHSEGPNTRSHPELGRENPQRPWYCRSSGGRVGRRQARQTPQLSLIIQPLWHSPRPGVMGETFVLAIDQGTTSTRAILFDMAGRVRSNAQIALAQLHP